MGGRKKRGGPLFFKPERGGTHKPARNGSGKNRPEETLNVTVDRLSAEGRGMAFHNGRPLFIAGALPGETVRVRLLVDKREYAEAELLDVVAAASERITPRCELFGRCGGCALQMLDDAAQLRHKTATLAHLLRAHVDTLEAPIVAGPWHYRHRARLTVSGSDAGEGGPVLGFKAAHSHRVVPVSACAVLDTALQPLLAKLPQWLARLSQWRRIEEIFIAVDSGGTLALDWNARRPLPSVDIESLRAVCAAENIVCAGAAPLRYAVPSQNSAFDFSVRDFTQVNPAANDLLVSRALEWLRPAADEVVSDFFCGLGNFSLPLAKYAQKVIGFEIDTAMVARATASARHVVNIEFRSADLYAADAPLGEIGAAALLDPPRAGARVLCERLADTTTLRRLIYVSCNPHTLIRDIETLVRGGFDVDRAALVDMFPQTGHIETIALLRRHN